MPSVSTWQAVDVAIGLILLYLVLSLICSGLNELVARAFSLRAGFLEKGLRNLLDDGDGTGLAAAVLNHPLVRALSRNGAPSIPTPKSTPSYLPAQTFSLALFDTIAPRAGDATGDSRDLVAAAAARIKDVPSDQVRRSLMGLLDEARGDVDRFRANVEDWYDASMTRVSGWYKRRVQVILMVFGIVLAIGLNADSFQVANSLYSNDATRAAVVAQATQLSKTPPSSQTPQQQLESAGHEVSSLQALKFPIGWGSAAGDPRRPPRTVAGWVGKVFGWLVTGFAVSLGAPFWFDVLGRALSLRSSGPPPATTGTPVTPAKTPAA